MTFINFIYDLEQANLSFKSGHKKSEPSLPEAG
jgi:hypothetical protein